MPKVSVNIPCFNSEKYIAETLRSILNQTFKDFEVILVNDGSTDRTEEIIKTFSDPRIKYYYQKNMGLSNTRNKQIALSSGEFIAFLDHDDLWVSHKLEKQMVLFKKNSEAVLVYSDCLFVDADGRYVGKWTKHNKLYRGMVFKKLLSSNFVPLPTVVLKKTIFEEIGNFLPYKNAEEYDLFLKCALRYPFDYIDEPLAKYRVHELNYGITHSDIAFKEAIEIYNFWNQEKFIQDDTIKKIIKKGLSNSYYYYGRSIIYQEKDSSKARQYFRQGLKHNFNWKTFLLFLFSFINPFVLLKLSRIVKKTLKRY